MQVTLVIGTSMQSKLTEHSEDSSTLLKKVVTIHVQLSQWFIETDASHFNTCSERQYYFKVGNKNLITKEGVDF